MTSLLLFILDVITISIGIVILVIAGCILYTIYKGGGYSEVIENLKKVWIFSLNLLHRGEKVAMKSGEYTKLTASILAKNKEKKDNFTELGRIIVKNAKKLDLPADAEKIISAIHSIDKEITKMDKQRKAISEKILSE